MKSVPSHPISTKNSYHLYGLGIQVSKMEPMLPRISSNQHIKDKKQIQTSPVMFKKLFKLGNSPLPTQPCLSQKSPYKALKLLKSAKIDKKMILPEIRRLRQKTIGQGAQNESIYRRLISYPSFEFSNKLQKIQKLSIQHRAKKSDVERGYLQIRNQYLMDSRGVVESKPQVQIDEIRVDDRKDCEDLKRGNKRFFQKSNRLVLQKIDSPIKLRKVMDFGTIDGYGVDNQNQQIDICEYMDRNKSICSYFKDKQPSVHEYRSIQSLK